MKGSSTCLTRLKCKLTWTGRWFEQSCYAALAVSSTPSCPSLASCCFTNEEWFPFQGKK